MSHDILLEKLYDIERKLNQHETKMAGTAGEQQFYHQNILKNSDSSLRKLDDLGEILRGINNKLENIEDRLAALEKEHT